MIMAAASFGKGDMMPVYDLSLEKQGGIYTLLFEVGHWSQSGIT